MLGGMPDVAFETLVDRHGPVVMRFLIARLGPIDAEDAFQETMLSALRAYPDLRDAGAARAWLLRIAARAAHDAGRARRRRPIPVADVPDRPDPHAPEDPSGVWSGVRRLPDKQRTAVVLRVALDLAYREIGEVMRTSPEAARRNVHEGLSTLRDRADKI